SPQLGPLVFTHHRDLPQRVTAQLADYLHEIVTGGLAPDYDRKVAPNAGKPWERAGLGRHLPTHREAIKENLGRHRPPRQSDLGKRGGMQFADDADRLAGVEDFGTAPGVEPSGLSLPEIGWGDRQPVPHRRQGGLQRAQFSGSGITGARRDVDRDRKQAWFIDGTGRFLPEARAELEEPSPWLILASIERQRLEKSRQQAPPKRVAVLGHRVPDANKRPRCGGHGNVRRPGRTNQGVGDGFINLAAGQHLARDLVGVLALIQVAQRGTLPWQRAGNAVVAVDPPDLL